MVRYLAGGVAGAGGSRTGDDPVTAYQAVAEELANVLYVTYGAADALGIDRPGYRPPALDDIVE